MEIKTFSDAYHLDTTVYRMFKSDTDLPAIVVQLVRDKKELEKLLIEWQKHNTFRPIPK